MQVPTHALLLVIIRLVLDASPPGSLRASSWDAGIAAVQGIVQHTNVLRHKALIEKPPFRHRSHLRNNQAPPLAERAESLASEGRPPVASGSVGGKLCFFRRTIAFSLLNFQSNINQKQLPAAFLSNSLGLAPPPAAVHGERLCYSKMEKTALVCLVS